MLIPKANRELVYNHLFAEGVMVAKKDVFKPKHDELNVPNLHVIKLLQSLKSRGYVKENFSWQWYYWYLTNEGVSFLRDALHLPADTMPLTLIKKPTAAAPTGARPAGRRFERDGEDFRGDREYRRDDKKAAAPGEFKPEFRGDRPARGRGFGRGAAPAAAPAPQ
eukprot:TRINITY_DN18924_c0_g1_i1.p2 TRINITY_DN18924_c0_g1~~TRINITY_DN18924_c0_g1_i1.p2  ORF type:complete len:173 (-),score=37.17 TRINITY_DN18924_c0_g1_i1:30-524(-)